MTTAVPRAAVGIDVGGTKIAGGLVTPDGWVHHRQVIPTPADPAASLQAAVELAGGLLQAAGDRHAPVAGIGVGVPELVDAAGRLRSRDVVGWDTEEMTARFTALAPTVVDADVRAAAAGEAAFGAGRDWRTFAYVTVGTGISHCLVLDGRPYPGAHGYALVLASGEASHTCGACGATETEVLEHVAAGPGVTAAYRAAGGRATNARDVLARSADGDRRATAVLATAGAKLGAAVGFLVNVTDPEAVVVGGGLGLAGGHYRAAFETSLRRHVWAEELADLPVLPAGLGPDAGLVGAAMLVRAGDGERP